MGKIFCSGETTTGIKSIIWELEALVDSDFNSRNSEEDMYRGDFGSNAVSDHPVKVYQAKSEAKILKNAKDFIDTFQFEDYQIDYAITGQAGWQACSTKFKSYGPSTGPLRFKYSNETYRNITEVKKLLKDDIYSAQQFVGEELFDSKSRPVGIVQLESRIYKSKPKVLPKKYQWIEEYVHVTYGSYNGY